MIPDVEVEELLGTGCAAPRGCLPIGDGAIAAYVSGFVATAQSVVRNFPGRRVVFEPMNEPWNLGTPTASSGYPAAAAYAAMLARLLPALAWARNPSVPLDRVYIRPRGVCRMGPGGCPTCTAPSRA